MESEMKDSANNRPDELPDWIARFRDDVLTSEDSRSLNERLATDREARELWVSHLLLQVHLQKELRFAVVQGESPLEDYLQDEIRKLPSSVARRRPTPRSSSFLRGLLRRMVTTGGESPAATALTWMVMAILLSGTILTTVFILMMVFGPRGGQQDLATSSPHSKASTSAQVSQPKVAAQDTSSVARMIRAVDCRWETAATSPKTGDDLLPGRKLALKSGLAEIVFQGGARTLLEGPATLEIRSRMGVYLQQGKFTVTVENPLAKGFEVRAPGMKYTDLGTEFGVLVAANGDQEVHVFRGTVQAEADNAVKKSPGDGQSTEPPPPPQAPSTPLVLKANEAIRVPAPHSATPNSAGKADESVQRIASDDKQFTRNLTPSRFQMFGTGVDLDRGASDPHWELSEISTDESFKPQAALVADPLPIYLRDVRGTAQWISKEQTLKVMPDACRCTFRTKFDLKGFYPSTARIEGRIMVDDYLVEIRLNGKVVALPDGGRGPLLYAKKLAFKVDEGFVAGENTLEIVIENSVNAAKGYVNTMALCAECKGTAVPIPTSKSNK
jgi:ferric-dicitrate binding protein FerR (iron transport regulator)